MTIITIYSLLTVTLGISFYKDKKKTKKPLK
jgi:hypothetical protein